MPEITNLPGDIQRAKSTRKRQRTLLLWILITFALVLAAISIDGRLRGGSSYAQASVHLLSSSTPDWTASATKSQTPQSTSSKPLPSRTASPSASPTSTEISVLASPTQPSTAVLFQEASIGKGTVFLALSEQGYTHIFAYNPLRMAFTRLTSGAWDDITPSASPDGNRIAFASNRNGYWDIYILDLTSGEITQVTHTHEYDASPTWSPDGLWLVYESYQPPLEAGNSSPNGTAVPGADSNSGENLELLILPTTGDEGGAVQPIRLTDHPAADFAPAWSPGGRQIAFVSDRNGEEEIWLADLDQVENRFRDLSHSPTTADRHPSWSPDGKWLAWSASQDGYATINLLEAANPTQKTIQPGNGDQPIWSPDGKAVLTSIVAPNITYLSGFEATSGSLALPPVPLPGGLQGLSWGTTSLPSPLAEALLSSAQLTTTPSWQAALTPLAQIPNARQHVVPLTDIQTSYPYLHDMVDEAFVAWRKATAARLGWDALANLENAFVPLTAPLSPGMQEDWLYTGRAIALNSVAMNAGWMVVVREDYGAMTYWRVFVRTRFQDGSQGQPLHDLPWNFNARYSGDPRFYEQGGAPASRIPRGYWLDLTRLANDYGWERLPALSTWRSAFQAARFNEFVRREGLDWFTAMQELYPVEALYTPTVPAPPSPTATRTRWPTRTPTLTRTPWPTRTPTPTRMQTTPTPPSHTP